MINTPILFVVFNRLDYVKKSIQPILENCNNIFICSEGYNNEEEKTSVEAVRDYLFDLASKYPFHSFKWFIRDKNYGCEQNILDSFKWISSLEEEFIVVEEDVLTTEHFYRFIENNKSKVSNEEYCCISKVLYNCFDGMNFHFNPHGWYVKSKLFWEVFSDWEKYTKQEYLEKIIKDIHKPSKDTYIGLKNTLIKKPFYWDEFYKYSIYFKNKKILYFPSEYTNHIGRISSNQHGFIWLEDGSFQRIN